MARSRTEISPAGKSRFIVYILRCADGTLYTGHTNDLKARLELHNSGKGAKYVRGRTPVKAVYASSCRTRSLAAKEEYRIKTLSREEKEALIAARRRLT